MNANDNNNEKHADPEHHTLDRKEGCPQKSDKGDQVKHNPCPDVGDLHVDLIVFDHLIKYL